MAVWDEFLTEFPMRRERPLSAEEMRAFEGRSSELVRSFLAQVGLASSKSFFFTVGPHDGDAALEAWGVDPGKAAVFLTTSFGLHIFATPTGVGTIDPFTGKGQMLDLDVAFSMLSLDLLHWYPEFESRGLGDPPITRAHVFAMDPPVKLGGHFANGYGGEANVVFRREPRAAHVAYQASLYENRVRGLPRNVMLAKRAVKPKAKPARAVPSPFRDAALHHAVVGGLFDAGRMEAARVRDALARFVGAKVDDEDVHLERAVKALAKLALARDDLRAVTRLAHSPEFERVFETILDVETGGEADYMHVRSLTGIQALSALEEIDVASLEDPSAQGVGLAPLLSLPHLRRVIVRSGANDRNLKKLVARGVEVVRRAG